MQPRRAGALALGFSLAGVVLVVLLVGVAAGVGPVRPGPRHAARLDLPRADGATVVLLRQRSRRRPNQATPFHEGHSGLPAAGLIGTLLRIALALWLLSLLWRGLRWVAEDFAAPPEPRARAPRPCDFDVLDDPEPLVEEIAQGRRPSSSSCSSAGEPRNAIVACWDRFEEQAERVGPGAGSRGRPPRSSPCGCSTWSRPTPRRCRGWPTLYREARFSEHEIDRGRPTAGGRGADADPRHDRLGADGGAG